MLDLNGAWVMVGNGIYNNLGIPFKNNLPKAQLPGEDDANLSSFGPVSRAPSGYGRVLLRAPITWPLSFRTTTPIPHWPHSLKTAPSTFALYQPGGEGFQRVGAWGWCAVGELHWDWNSNKYSLEASKICKVVLLVSPCCTAFRFQRNQVVVAKYSRFLGWFCFHYTSKKFQKVWWVGHEARELDISHLPYCCCKVTTPERMTRYFHAFIQVTLHFHWSLAVSKLSFSWEDVFTCSPNKVFNFVWAVEFPNCFP